MNKNVGKREQKVRGTIGPLLIGYGLRRLRRSRTGVLGWLSLLGGAALVQTAIRRSCPINKALGINTLETDELESTHREHLQPIADHVH